MSSFAEVRRCRRVRFAAFAAIRALRAHAPEICEQLQHFGSNLLDAEKKHLLQALQSADPLEIVRNVNIIQKYQYSNFDNVNNNG